MLYMTHIYLTRVYVCVRVFILYIEYQGRKHTHTYIPDASVYISVCVCAPHTDVYSEYVCLILQYMRHEYIRTHIYLYESHVYTHTYIPA